MIDVGRVLVWLLLLAMLAIFWVGVYQCVRWIVEAIW